MSAFVPIQAVETDCFGGGGVVAAAFGDVQVAGVFEGRDDGGADGQGMRPGTMERHGLGAEQVAEISPHCVYVSISAYGGGSELEDRPGIDMIVQAEAGCLSGQPQDRLPALIPFQLVDGATGHVAAQAVLAALLHRERFGVVNEVKVSMYDVACSLQSNYLTLHMNT